MTPAPSRRVAGLERTLIREIFERAPAGAVNLGLGEPDLDPPPALREALAEEARRGPAGYGTTAGEPELRAAIAAGYPGFAAGAADVLATAGAQQAMFAVLGALVDPGDEVLVPEPGFPGPARAAAAWNAAVRRYPLRPERGFHADPDEVLALAGPRTRAIVVNSPANPTGTVEPAATLERLVQAAAARGMAVVLDDIYRGFTWIEGGCAPRGAAGERSALVVVGGLSKVAAVPGWRVGWAVTPDRAFMARLVALQQTLLTCAPRPPQRAARVLSSAAGQSGLAALRERYRARRDRVARQLGRSGVRHAPLEGAFYAWLDASEGGGGRAVAERLLAEGIVVIPGEAFGPSARDWIRVSYACPEERLFEALERVVAAVRGA